MAGAYWRGDETRKQLTRLYGVTFPKKKELDEYLVLLEEAKKRDHRKLGKELELFTFSERVGQGLPLWLPKGAEVREKLETFLKKAQIKAGYTQVISPHIGHKNLYVTSGHYEKYKENMFLFKSEGAGFGLKSMNCPSHCMMFAHNIHSYRDLPLRYADFGTLHRDEVSGALCGLIRVRRFQ